MHRWRSFFTIRKIERHPFKPDNNNKKKQSTIPITCTIDDIYLHLLIHISVWPIAIVEVLEMHLICIQRTRKEFFLLFSISFWQMWAPRQTPRVRY